MAQNAKDGLNQESTCYAGGFPLLWSAFALVPQALIEDENPDLWLNFLRERVPHDQVISSTTFEELGLVCLYEAKKEREHVIPYILSRACAHEMTDNAVCAIRDSDKLAVVCFINGQLHLGNIYEATTKEQTLYWILKIYEVLQIPASVTLYLQCGEATRKLITSHLHVEPF